MSEPPAFERVLASLYDAMLDDTRWPATSALIDEACGVTGNALLVGEGPEDDIRVLFVGRPARRTTRAVWRGWWRRRCRPPGRSRSVDRCCWAACPGCR